MKPLPVERVTYGAVRTEQYSSIYVHAFQDCGRGVHGVCAGCGYNRVRLPTPRCPECGTKFDPDDLEMQSDDKLYGDDDFTPPESGEARRLTMPITCAACNASLPSVRDSGTCPRCGEGFDRRERLFELYGPEAFLDEPTVGRPVHPARATARASYRRAAIFSVVAVLSIPIAQYFVEKGAIGADRMPFAIFLFVIAVFEWIRASREATPRDGGDAGDSGAGEA